MRTWKSVCGALATCLVIVTVARAQDQDKARIFGTVTDKRNTVVYAAKIKIKPHCKCSECDNPERCDCCPNQVTVTTDKEGHFEAYLKPGSYSLETQGKKLDVQVHRNQNKNIDIVVK